MKRLPVKKQVLLNKIVPVVIGETQEETETVFRSKQLKQLMILKFIFADQLITQMF